MALGAAATAQSQSSVPAMANTAKRADVSPPSTAAPVFSQPVFRPIDSPSPSPSPSPWPSPFPPWGNHPTYELDVRPNSPSDFSVFVECRRSDLTYPSFDSDGILLSVTSADGLLRLDVPPAPDNRGLAGNQCDPYPFAVLKYTLRVPLIGSREPYTVAASTIEPFAVASSSDILVTDVPRHLGEAVGSRYIGIEAAGFGGIRTGQLFRYAGRNKDVERVFVSLEDGHDVVTRADNDQNDGFGPTFDGPDTAMLRKEFLNVAVSTRNFEFTCYNGKNERARVKLLAGKYLRIVTIVRAAHEMRWIPNDPRMRVYAYPCNGRCSERSGTFVDSPIVVAIQLAPDSVEVIPPQTISRPIHWTGNCIGGFVLMQNAAQFRDVFSAMPPPVSQ